MVQIRTFTRNVLNVLGAFQMTERQWHLHEMGSRETGDLVHEDAGLTDQIEQQRSKDGAKALMLPIDPDGSRRETPEYWLLASSCDQPVHAKYSAVRK
jgi:hypothetical protein